MLTVREAAEQLTAAGIAASEDDVTRWIKQGKLKAESINRRVISYKIPVKDLIDFSIKIQTAELQSRLADCEQEHTNLKDHVELLKTRVHIEQSKVRTLKRLLEEQILSSAEGSSFHYAELLGLEQDSDSRHLKREFKKLLKALHPDRAGDERLFKVFKEHYEKLKA
ncbi:DnaJ domain-containing protein [Bacillus sp. EB01]|uniref:DnaJ domain-containing protein n=1 Tax=Bacillus sp. EB01 TaxID=1347086 RepID=UPI0005C481C3|nr:DnaJ domain-containing protein [Bacillus sp. EB01]